MPSAVLDGGELYTLLPACILASNYEISYSNRGCEYKQERQQLSLYDLILTCET